MIFVILGSQRFQFNRLLEKIDELVENGIIQDEVFAQTGGSNYEPKHYSYKAYINHYEFEEMLNKSNTVITHGGTGAIISAIKRKIKVIVVPRLKRYGEHVDDHQLQLLEQFERLHLVCACYDLERLGPLYKSLKDMVFNEYSSNTQLFIDRIDSYLSSLSKNST